MKTLFLLSIFFFFQNLQAATDVSCWDNCLTHGWTSKDLQTGQLTDYGCYRDGCETSGWIIGTRPKSYTQCKGKGCFQEGWYQLSSDTQMMEKQVICRTLQDSSVSEPNCFKYGWATYNQYGQESVASCLHGDCANQGWQLKYPSQKSEHFYCKAGGCFTTGWKQTDF